MNISTEHSNDPIEVSHQQSRNQLEWNRRHYKAAFLMMIAIIACGILFVVPQYFPSRFAGITLGIGPATYMTGYLCLYPNSLCNRTGSLNTAICLIAFLWLVAIGSVAAFVSGVIE
ncbi:hypothetical protein SH528x_002440 [Novipirellula sp. SH528]|uniref:hypothetical protein n=1 Tax=Novipirellula sp. SH528 TaxID=3454466 RepID=UPI003FA0B8BB